MSVYFWQLYAEHIAAIQLLVLILNTVLHIIFAGAVARDAGQLVQRGQPIFLVSGMIWAFATLIGGIFVAVVYWVMHHAQWPRS